jgi:hypothetical protein
MTNMSRFKKPLSLLSTFSLLMLIFWISNQEILAEETLKIDADTKAEVVNKVAGFMKDYYYSPKTGEKMGNHINRQHKKGEYDSYTDVKEFCRKLTADLREICHDRHIFVFYSPEEAAEVAAKNNLLPEEKIKKIEQRMFERNRKVNFGFHKVEILKGNIGYLDLRQFSNPDYAGETAIGVMHFISHADAVIVDLRKNGGGSEEMVSLLCSYFVPKRVHLINSYYRPDNKTMQFWTFPYIPGKRMPDVDLYILTSSRSFSAAEEFAFDMKHLKRGIIVGETTKGGAHPVDVKIVKGSILTQISIGESFHPDTKANWEGIGVEPHVKVPEKDALTKAHLLALERIIKKEKNEQLIFEYQWLADTLKSMLEPFQLDTNTMKSYVGVYGPRIITFENGALYYHMENQPKMKMIPMNENTFRFAENDSFRLQIVKEGNRVTAVKGLYDNGNSDMNKKTN